MMHRRERILCGWLFVLLSVVPGTTRAQELRRPIAMDKIDSGDLFILGLSGRLYRLRTQTGGMSLVSQTDLPNAPYPVDLTSAKLNNQPVLFVSYNTDKYGAVSSYSLDGKVNRTWLMRSGVSGLDVDYNTQTLYVASSDSGEISSINVNSNEGPKFVASIPDARKLGPLVLHVPRKMLYVADAETGNIYELDLTTKKARLIAPKLGIPAAMLVLEERNLLLVADSAGKIVYSLLLGSPTALRAVFAALPDFRSPSGLARLAPDQIAVSDDITGRLFIFEQRSVETHLMFDQMRRGTFAHGELLYSYPAH